MAGKSLLPVLFFLIFCAGASAAAPADASAAHALYDKGDFAGARAAYEALIQAGPWSANLFYNLGNAAFRQGEKGAAFLAYERALALEPGHPEAQANLRFLREETGAKLPGTSWVDRALAHPAGNTAGWLAAAAFWGICFSLAPLAWRRRAAGAPALLCALALGWSGAAIWWQNSQGALWIVTAPIATARTEPADNAAATAKLPVGSHVHLLLERGAWLNVRLPDATKGWLARDAAEPVRLAR
ncbi:MAG: tetratricopeptide repeat protein [Verrucomicrobiota bacterium]